MPVSGDEIPEAQEHLDYFPLRILAIAGNIAGTAAVVWVAIATIRRRPLAMSLILAGVAVAAVGTRGCGARSCANCSISCDIFAPSLRRFYDFQRKTRAFVAWVGTLVC